MIKPGKACAEQPHRGQCRRGGNLMARTRTRLHAPFTLHRGIGIPTQSMGSIKAHVEVDAFLKNSFWRSTHEQDEQPGCMEHGQRDEEN